MHEISVMTQLVETILEEIEKYDYEKVESVEFVIGELTFLAEEQLKFAFEILSEKTPLKGAELKIIKKDPVIKCKNCDYSGPIEFKEDPTYHMISPYFACPKCEGEVEIIEGRECMVKNVELTLTEDSTAMINQKKSEIN